MSLYSEKDMVVVVGDDGEPLAGFTAPVPKAWIGTGLLPEGAKQASKTQAAKVDDPPADQPPAKSASKADWVAYAVAQGAAPDEAAGKTRDELVEAYSPKA